MAKKSGSSSWLTAVKRAFRSPTKDINIEKNRHENHYQHEHDDHEDQKKREKRRWLFRKPTIYSTDQQKITTKVNNNNNNNNIIIIDDRIEVKDIISSSPGLVAPPQEKRSAAAAVTTQTAAEISRRAKAPKSGFVRDYCYAAIVIQAAFRGYLGRRALRALKGVVKLQALVRGQNVRKQAKLTLKCMQALVRVQEQVSHQRARLSLESTRMSMLADISPLLSDYDIRDRLSISREMSSSGVSDWDDCPQTSEDIEAKLLIKREAALKREKALAYASFSNQIRSRAQRNEESEDKIKWLDRWMATKQWESDYNDNSPSAERRDQNITTVHVDTSRLTRPYQAPKAHQTTGPYSSPNIPSSPSPSKPRPLKVRSASPRCQSVAHTPTLAHYGSAMVPNYMAATESARARARPNSTPRQRPSTPERDPLGRSGSSAKKRLSYNSILEPTSHLTSPSFKSLQNGYLFGLETLSSCYDESVWGRDVSPCSTTDLRWLK